MAGIPGLGDRATMEQERLARLAARYDSTSATGKKRERSISPPPMARPTKVTKLASNFTSKPDTKTLEKAPDNSADVDLDTPSPPVEQQASSLQQSAQTIATSISASRPALAYPTGVIRKTWAFGHTRDGNDIKIEEVLEKNTLRTGVLSAFQWDVEWVSSKVNRAQTKFVYIMQAKEQSMRDQMLEETKDMRKTLRLCFPPMDGQINCMHSKLMLLFHPHKLRVAIPSANLMPYDWGETGIMENSVFLVDLPRLPKDETKTLTSFATELLYFLEQQGLDEDIRQGLLNFDFSSTSHISFIHTSGGIHYGTDLQRTGFMGLNKAVQEHGLTSQPNLQIDFAASSIGSLNDDQLRNIHTAARGQFPATLPPKPTKKESETPATDIRKLFRIYFPTLETVAMSTGGVDNGGTICFQRKWWEGVNRFPRDCFRDYQSVRQGLLSHNKILYARGHCLGKKDKDKDKDGNGGKSNKNFFSAKSSGKESKTDDDGGEEDEKDKGGNDIAWVYMGSANMSESAWGKLVWDAKRKEWKLNCKNWECGVLMRVPGEQLRDPVYEQRLVAQESEKKKKVGDKVGREIVSLEVFDGVVKVPFQYPGREYEGRQPWYFTEPHP